MRATRPSITPQRNTGRAMSQENVELVYRVLDAFNRRDLDAALALVHGDVEFGSRLAAMEGGYDGHEGIRRWWRTILDASPDRMIEIVEVRDLGDVTLTRAQARGHGAVSQIPYEETICPLPSGVARRPSGGVSSQPRPKPSKPWGWGSRRCRRRM
jgi:hypothetical protein